VNSSFELSQNVTISQDATPGGNNNIDGLYDSGKMSELGRSPFSLELDKGSESLESIPAGDREKVGKNFMLDGKRLNQADRRLLSTNRDYIYLCKICQSLLNNYKH